MNWCDHRLMFAFFAMYRGQYTFAAACFLETNEVELVRQLAHVRGYFTSVEFNVRDVRREDSHYATLDHADKPLLSRHACGEDNKASSTK